jgi:glycerol-3-phosphate dehydrogenase (NAD(P)+)
MAVITILGAGYMGSAFAMIAADAGHEVRLWGTWLDDALIEPTRRGDPHPRLKLRLHGGVRTFFSPELAPALEGATTVVCAVKSDGVLPVLERALPHLPPSGPLLSVTKGFLPDEAGTIGRVSVAVRRRLLQPAGKDRPWVAVGGPCKAMEVARRVPTAVIFASEELGVAEAAAGGLESTRYTITRTDDLAGVEACSAFKNAYATASGLCDGLQLAGNPEMHNTRAMLFAQAVREIARMVVALGGNRETAYGLAGVGDLHVTAAAGRNRAYGERVGRGDDPAQAAAEMERSGELTEGYPALQTGWDLLRQQARAGRLAVEDFPLLAALHAVVYDKEKPATLLKRVRVRG